MKIAKHIAALEEYVPGEQPKSKRVIKLNTNENPYPPSPKCAEVLKSFDLDKLRRYPDPNCEKLREAIAKLNKTTIDKVFIGNGSDEILSLAARCFVEDNESIGSLDPSYSLYKTLAAIRNVKWMGVEGVDKRCRCRKDVSLFLLTNPNAPTGEFREPEQIAAFAKSFPGVVLIDEAYADFAHTNCMKLATAENNKNTLVMRTFSKSYSLAGLRVGYCVGPTELITALYKAKDSYNVDAVAQAVALAAIKDQKWMKANAASVINERRKLTAELTKLGWDVIPSESNFIFAKPPTKAGEKPHETAAHIFAELKKRNIFVRYFKYLNTRERLRITIGLPTQNQKLLQALKEITK